MRAAPTPASSAATSPSSPRGQSRRNRGVRSQRSLVAAQHSELLTTLTEENAIAAPPITG